MNLSHVGDVHVLEILILIQTTQNYLDMPLPQNISSAFSGSAATNILLPVGTSLYRFTSDNRVSQWWTETNQLANMLLSAKSSGKTLVEYMRHNSAVLRQWSPDMFHLYVIALTHPVNAYKGGIAPQNEAARFSNPNSADYKKKFTKSVFMSGGGSQVYIPNFQRHQFREIVPIGAVNVYDAVDGILDFLLTYKLI